jgi:hypothetical protein
MESFMDAPVGVFAEEAGDAELLLTPHHGPSIPARAARGNRASRKNEDRNERAKLASNACFWDPLTVERAPPYASFR